MTNRDTGPEGGWGTPPSLRYEDLAARFRPVFARIAASAVERDTTRRLPHAEIRELRDAGFPLLRLPEDLGGAGASLPELFGLLLELSAADSNVTNALRAHFGFTEEVLNHEDAAWRGHWLGRIAAGDTVGSGHSETGENPVGGHTTRLESRDGRLFVTGRKFYTTGSLFADWINTALVDEAGEIRGVLVPVRAAGVAIDDDWDGFGQALTASGTARFEAVEVDPVSLRPGERRLPYGHAFYQLVHLATLAGIARAASAHVARLLAERRRIYARGNANRAADDPQLLQVVGRVRSAAYAAGAVALHAAEALERVWQAHRAGEGEERIQELAALAELEVSQSVTVVSTLVLEATTLLFDALGASATRRGEGLDRYWRNARTITSHNPRVYHDRIVGRFAVTGEIERGVPGVGLPPAEDAAPADAEAHPAPVLAVAAG